MSVTWLRTVVIAAALIVGVSIGVGFAFLHKARSTTHAAALRPPPPNRPAATWAAGVRPAPDFHLRDQNGDPISLRSLRGRTVLLSFIDPVCQNLCPLEAKVLASAARQFGSSSRLAIVSVSVNPWGQSPKILRRDIENWRLAPNWRWAVGRYRALASVWHEYAIGVRVTRTRFKGIPVRRIDHTEASYVIDAKGYQRAVFVFPFQPGDVARTLDRLSGGAGS